MTYLLIAFFLGALVAVGCVFTGAFLFYRADRKESPLPKLPTKKNKIIPPKRDEDIEYD